MTFTLPIGNVDPVERELGLIGDIFSSLWFLADIAFYLGMIIAVNSDFWVHQFCHLFQDIIIPQWTLSGKQTPQHIQRYIEVQVPVYLYKLSCLLLTFAFFFNIGNNLFMRERRGMIVNILFFLYPLTTVGYTLNDVMLHDDKKLWKTYVKSRHILMPFNLEGKKLFAADFTDTQVDTQLSQLVTTINQHMPFFMFNMVLGMGIYGVIPRVLFLLACPSLLIAHNAANNLLDVLYDTFTLNVFKNRFQHNFGDWFEILDDNVGHDYFGKQYMYFNYSFRPLERFANHYGLKHFRNKGFSLGESLAVYYLLRGAMVATFLGMLNLVNKNLIWERNEDISTSTRILTGLSPVIVYYSIHAAFGWYNAFSRKERQEIFNQAVSPLERGLNAIGAIKEGERVFSSEQQDFKNEDWFNNFPKRYMAIGIESLLAGHLIYRPILDWITDTSATLT